MQSTSVAALPCYCFPEPSYFLHFRDLHLKKKPNSLSLPRCQIHIKNNSSFTLYAANCFSNEQQENLKRDNESNPDDNHTFSDYFYSSTDTNKLSNVDPETQNQQEEEAPQYKDQNYKVIFTNMWWADLKASLGQIINVEGIVSSTMILVKDRHLALPHVTVPDIWYIDWGELRRRGFKGVVFDKDNTITAPYTLTLWGPLSSSIEECKSVFGHDIAVFSNSAGLYEYDRDGSKARILERKIGIKVIRHGVKKPAGTAEEIGKHFGCQSSQLIMVGDRPFTDIVYGNRNGFLTILTEPLSLAEEPFIVRQELRCVLLKTLQNLGIKKNVGQLPHVVLSVTPLQVRKLELILVNRWFRRGLKPISHSLLPDARQCVKDPPVL